MTVPYDAVQSQLAVSSSEEEGFERLTRNQHHTTEAGPPVQFESISPASRKESIVLTNPEAAGSKVLKRPTKRHCIRVPIRQRCLLPRFAERGPRIVPSQHFRRDRRLTP